MELIPAFNEYPRRQLINGIGITILNSLLLGFHFILEFSILSQNGLPIYFVIFHFIGLSIGSLFTIKLGRKLNHFLSFMSYIALMVLFFSVMILINQPVIISLCLFGGGFCIGSSCGLINLSTYSVNEKPENSGRLIGLAFLITSPFIILQTFIDSLLIPVVYVFYILIVFLIIASFLLYGRKGIKWPTQNSLNLIKYLKKKENLPTIALAFFIGFFTTNTYYAGILILELMGALNSLYTFVITIFLVNIVVSLFIGLFADKFGRKLTILLGLCIQALGFLLLSFLGINLTVLVYIFPIPIGIGYVMANIGSNLSFGELSEPKYIRDTSSVYMIFLGFGCVGGVLIAEIFRSLLISQPFYFTIMLLFVFVIATLSVSQLKETLPSKEEIEWKTSLQEFFCITSTNGICIYHYNFLEESNIDPQLFAGGISGVCSLVQEMTQSQKRTKVIDQEDKTLLLEFGDYITCVLLCTSNLHILRNKLKEIIQEIEFLFKDELVHWTGKIDIFNPIGKLIKRYFT